MLVEVIVVIMTEGVVLRSSRGRYRVTGEEYAYRIRRANSPPAGIRLIIDKQEPDRRRRRLNAIFFNTTCSSPF